MGKMQARLLKENPLRGLRLPREENNRCPVATYDRFLKLRTVVQELAKSAARKDHGTQWVRLELALILAEATGARLGAINGLRWSDITCKPPRIHWRAVGKAHDMGVILRPLLPVNSHVAVDVA